MSDFLCSIGNRYKGQDLLNLIQKPYGDHAPKGQAFDFPWGQIAILEEHLANNSNILAKDGTVFAWVGDLVTDVSEEFVDALITRIGQIKNCRADGKISLESDEIFKKLNGTFAIIIAEEQGLSIVTDLVNSTPVYKGIDEGRHYVGFGTHPDVVAAITGESLDIDLVSIGEFINSGSPSFPNTTYKNVRELDPGCLIMVDSTQYGTFEIRSRIYWFPPAELDSGCNENDLAAQLTNALVSSVKRRCKGEKVGIKLSGGLDSRLVMAAIPKSVKCIGLTFCDKLNRETQIAKRVSQCYKSQWFPLFREKEYLGNNLVTIVKFIGCEHEWVQVHGMGLTHAILAHNISCLLDGQWSNTFLNLYFADDILRRACIGGLLPPKYEKIHFDYVDKIKDFCRENMCKDLLDRMYLRRKDFYDKNADPNRGSMSEWLGNYPLSQVPDMASWIAERRIVPVRLVFLDRQIVEFGFRCPLELKLHGKIFHMATENIYGAGARIPNANDGVRPGSGHWSRLFQRAIRKLQDRTTKILEKLGREPKIQHSWHDYQKYWRESEKLDQLRQQYGANLNQFDGILFKDSGQELLENKDLDWRYGFRLLQLAVWLGIIEEYRNVLKGRSS